MTGQELATAVQYRAGLVVVVFNNGMYGTIRMHQERQFALPGQIEGELALLVPQHDTNAALQADCIGNRFSLGRLCSRATDESLGRPAARQRHRY